MKKYDCPLCGLRATREGHAEAYRGGQHENDAACTKFLRGLDIDAIVINSAGHDTLAAHFDEAVWSRREAVREFLEA